MGLPRIASVTGDDWIDGCLTIIQDRRAERIALVPIIAMLGDDIPSAIGRAERMMGFMEERYEAFEWSRQGRLPPQRRAEAEMLRRSYAILRQGVRDLRQVEAAGSGTR